MPGLIFYTIALWNCWSWVGLNIPWIPHRDCSGLGSRVEGYGVYIWSRLSCHCLPRSLLKAKPPKKININIRNCFGKKPTADSALWICICMHLSELADIPKLEGQKTQNQQLRCSNASCKKSKPPNGALNVLPLPAFLLASWSLTILRAPNKHCFALFGLHFMWCL